MPAPAGHAAADTAAETLFWPSNGPLPPLNTGCHAPLPWGAAPCPSGSASGLYPSLSSCPSPSPTSATADTAGPRTGAGLAGPQASSGHSSEHGSDRDAFAFGDYGSTALDATDTTAQPAAPAGPLDDPFATDGAPFPLDLLTGAPRRNQPALKPVFVPCERSSA